MMQAGRPVIRRWARDGVRLSMVLVWGLPWARPLPLSIGDQVTVPSLSGTGDAVVVARGGTTIGTCVYDRLRKGKGTLDIGQVVPKTGCASDVLLFAQYARMSATPHAWATGTDLVPLPSPGSRVQVNYSFVLVAKGGTAAQLAGRDTIKANELYNANRTGLSFHASRVLLPKDLSPTDVQTIGNGCNKTKLDVLATNTNLYDSKRLNVYFVPGLLGWRGYTCFTVGYPNVIYISIAGDSPANLAHELGHALGLQDWISDNGISHKLGHTGALATWRIQGFVYRNIMWTGLNDLQAQEQRHLSIGQGYRMNMDKISWVIRAGIVPGRAGLTCHPLVAEDSIPCPLLALDTVPTP